MSAAGGVAVGDAAIFGQCMAVLRIVTDWQPLDVIAVDELLIVADKTADLTLQTEVRTTMC